MANSAHDVRLALLGAHPLAKAWYAAIQQSPRHHVVASLASDLTDVPAVDHWQTLATDDRLDAALLYLPDADSLEAVQQLALRGKGVVIDGECPLPSSRVCELALLDAEGAAPVVPLFEWRAIPVYRQLQQCIVNRQLGHVVLVRIERAFVIASPTVSDRMLQHELVQSSLFQDIDLLRWFGGDYSQVTLFRTGATDRGFASQSLNLAGEGLPDATCTYRVGAEYSSLCEVQGSSGTATIQFGREGTRFTINGESNLTQQSARPDHELCLGLLDESLARKPGSLRWQDRVRIHEIQEAMQRSLRRRRTIDLHFETASERSQFKTQMATVGCFVLVYTFMACVCLLLAGAVFDPRDPIQRQAEAAGFIVPREEFVPLSAQLTVQGEQRLQGIADRWDSTGAVVVVEGAAAVTEAAAGRAEEDQARLAAVRLHLHERGVQRVEERTVQRQLAGQGFQRLMTLGRVIAFAPLGVFLLMQLLLLAARPSRAGIAARDA
ncbi:MAG: hypothetical protein AB7I48_24005 [Planctomycetaceae bacterium]